MGRGKEGLLCARRLVFHRNERLYPFVTPCPGLPPRSPLLLSVSVNLTAPGTSREWKHTALVRL